MRPSTLNSHALRVKAVRDLIQPPYHRIFPGQSWIDFTAEPEILKANLEQLRKALLEESPIPVVSDEKVSKVVENFKASKQLLGEKYIYVNTIDFVINEHIQILEPPELQSLLLCERIAVDLKYLICEALDCTFSKTNRYTLAVKNWVLDINTTSQDEINGKPLPDSKWEQNDQNKLGLRKEILNNYCKFLATYLKQGAECHSYGAYIASILDV